MKLSQLKELVDVASEAARKAQVDPEVFVAVLPQFPSLIATESLASSLVGDWKPQSPWNDHMVIIGEAHTNLRDDRLPAGAAEALWPDE